VEAREELVYLLGQACELEHGLMCEYLYAQFSLKRGLDEGRTVAQLDGVKAWETALISVTKQEMLHLALSTNILTAGFAAARHAQPLTVGDSGLVGVPQERRTVPQST
jgi:Ferritin-like